MKKEEKTLNLAFEIANTDEQRRESEIRAVGTVNSPIGKKAYLGLRIELAKSAEVNIRKRLEEVVHEKSGFPAQLEMLTRAPCWKFYETADVNRYPVRVFTSVTDPKDNITYAKYVMITDFNRLEYGITQNPEVDLTEVPGYWMRKHKKLIRTLEKVLQRGIWYDPPGFVIVLLQEAVAQQHASESRKGE